MIYTHTGIESRDGTLSAMLPVGVGRHGGADHIREQRNRLAAERAIDDVLADSFPASDPPSWNPGVTRPKPRVSMHHRAAELERLNLSTGGTRAGVIDMSRQVGDRTSIDALISLAGAVGIALLAPFGILLIGLPVALTFRSLLEVIGWLFGGNAR
jgi:hypothetical protein